MINESDTETRKYPKKENPASAAFYGQLADKVNKLAASGISMVDFNVFCCQSNPGLKDLSKTDKAGCLDLHDVAEYFRVDYMTIYRMVRRSEIAPTKIGGVYRIPAAAVLLYFDVATWHNGENDKEIRIQTMKEGNLQVLTADNSYFNVPNLWNNFVTQKFGNGNVPPEYTWNNLVQTIPES